MVLSAIKKLISRIKPGREFTVWFITTLAVIICFDIQWGTTMLVGGWTQLRMMWVSALLLAAICATPAAFTPRRWIPAVIISLLAIFLEANLMYSRTYFSIIPLDSYRLVGNLAGFGGSILSSLRWKDLLFPIFIITGYLLSKPSDNFSKSLYCWLILVISPVLILFLHFHFKGGFHNQMFNYLTNAVTMNTPTASYTPFAVLYYQYIDACRPIDHETIASTTQWLDLHNGETAKYAATLSTSDSIIPDVVLIMCESLESWPIELNIEGQKIMPFLSSIVSDTTQNYYNPYVLTQARGGRSIDGQLLYLAGRYPLTQGAFSANYPQVITDAIPNAYHEAGGNSQLISGDMPNVWHQSQVAIAMGFDSLLTRDTWARPEIDGDFQGGETILDHRLMERIRDARVISTKPDSSPRFSLIVTRTGHDPFELPEQYATLKLNESYPDWLSRNLQVNHYVDSALSIIVDDALKVPETVVVIVGDHEGLAAHRQEIAGDSRYDFVDNECHTPLIIINGNRQGRDSVEIGQVDIYSAIMDVAGLYHRYHWRGMGRSPFDPDYKGIKTVDYIPLYHTSEVLFRKPELLQ